MPIYTAVHKNNNDRLIFPDLAIGCLTVVSYGSAVGDFAEQQKGTQWGLKCQPITQL